MANNGYYDVNVIQSGKILLRYKWNAGTPNVANNFTPVTWTLQLISTDQNASISDSLTKNYSVTTNGSVKAATNTVNIAGGTTKNLASGSLNIPHNSDGTKTFSFSFSQDFNISYEGVQIGTITGNSTGTLDSIPRASTLGTINNFTIGNNISIPITKHTSSFSDTLRIYINDTLIKTVENIVNNQNVNFTSSELNSIYSLMPTITITTFKFVLTTYSGSDIVGTSTKTATGTISNNIKPSISNIAITEIVDGIASQFGAFIQNESRANVNVTYSVGTGSSLNSIIININGETLTSNNSNTNILNTAGTNVCTVIVTDKRGRTATSTQNFTVVEYSTPNISSLSVERCLQNGTLDEMGTYAKVNGLATITSVSNKNTKSFKLQYKQRNSSTWITSETYTSSYSYTITNKIISNISADSPYDFRILATDFFGDVSKVVELSSGFSIIDLKNNGKGIAFGKVSTKDAMEIGMPVYDRFDTQILNGLSIYNVDPNNSLEELILTQTNTPENSLFYVRTMFYNNKTANSNRTQIAYSYNQSDKKMFLRTYYNNTWSDWQAVNEYTETDLDSIGKSLIGNTLSFEWCLVKIKSENNEETRQEINFNRTYEKAPIVISVAESTGKIVTGVYVESIAENGATLVFTRLNSGATAIRFIIIGKVV